MIHKVGIDIGLTKIECAVLDPNNNIIYRERTSTENEQGTTHIYSKIKEIYQDAINKTKIKEFTIGIGMPGSISKNTSMLKNSGIFVNRKVAPEIEELLGHKVTIANDANCFALAESMLGAAKDYNLVFGIILGTGVGGGLVIKKKLRVGSQGVAGEWGHTDLDAFNELPCFCGKIGCVETWISGAGLERRYSSFNNGARVTAKEISTWSGGRSTIMMEYFDKFGQAVANLIQVIDPDCIVIGGGLSNVPLLYTEGPIAIKKHLFNDAFDTPVLPPALGDSAGVIGAALIGYQSN
jgi:fructokinase